MGMLAGGIYNTREPLAAAAVPSSVTGFDVDCPVSTNFSNVDPTGGVTPYTYLWTRQSGSTTWTIDGGPTVKNGRWSKSASGFHSAVWRCRVTDDATNFVDTNNVSVSGECGGV